MSKMRIVLLRFILRVENALLFGVEISMSQRVAVILESHKGKKKQNILWQMKYIKKN